jgi:diguanylate cyclase (GGDEF)-like protein
MNSPANRSVLLARRQIFWGLGFALLALLATIGASALLFAYSAFALLLPLPATVLFLGILLLLLQDHTSPAPLDTEASTTSQLIEIPPQPFAATERTITVDEDRELYGIYATLQTISASLNLSDTLNLVADRLTRLIPGATIVFALAESAAEPLSVAAKFGRYAELFTLGEALADDTAAAAARIECRAVSGLIWPKRLDPATEREDVRGWPAIAAPIAFEGAVFGAMTLIRGEGRGFIEAETAQLESVAIFAAPGIHQALTQKQTRDTAMLDPIMQLPNVRAAFTIVDQRIAESLRRRTDEPLGLICLRIATTVGADRDLREVGNMVSPQLRHMDILTRGDGNELLIVLPRAGRAEAALVASRILRALNNHSTTLASTVHLGLASYPVDGATGTELFECARENSRLPDSQLIDRSFDNVVLVDEWR